MPPSDPSDPSDPSVTPAQALREDLTGRTDRLQRVQQDDGPPPDDEWWNEPTPAPALAVDQAAAKAGQKGALLAVSALERAGARLGRHLLATVPKWTADADLTRFVVVAERLAEVRRRLAELEAILVRAAAYSARDNNLPRQGVFADGRLWELKRGTDRKAWSHTDWQADVRRQVMSGLPEQLVNPDTGEGVSILELLVAVEDAHGAGAPKVGVLKRLGLDPADYCEEVPGSWGLKVSAPEGGA